MKKNMKKIVQVNIKINVEIVDYNMSYATASQ